VAESEIDRFSVLEHASSGATRFRVAQETTERSRQVCAEARELIASSRALTDELRARRDEQADE
jgi:hypothetical protein